MIEKPCRGEEERIRFHEIPQVSLGMTGCGVCNALLKMTGRGKNVLFVMAEWCGRPVVAPTENGRIGRLTIQNPKVFCHVELVETSRGSAA